MIKLIVLFAVGVFTRQAYCDAPEKIVGGDYAYAGQFPHQVSMQIYGSHFCGGSIISPTHVITAAHCLENSRDYPKIEIVAGITQLREHGSRHRIKCVQIHPGYTGQMQDAWKDDIAVVTLQTPIALNNYQKAIRLASVDHDNGGMRGVTSGWGITDLNADVSPYLKWLGVNILSSNDCVRAHSNPRPNRNHICTLEKRGHGACSGDSGGPLVINGELCGVTSWVAPCALGVPDVFTKVKPYVSFIKHCQQQCP